MKYGLLKLSAITLAFGCSTVQACDVSVIPVQKSGYAISITGLYLQPNASNLLYAIHTTPLPLQAPNWEQKVVDPSYSGAFDLGLQYNFCNNVENVQFDWLHLNSKDSASANSTSETSVGPSFYYGPAEQFILNTSANSTVKFNIDNVNAIFGHLINLSNHIQIEPFVGLSAAYLKEDINDYYQGSDPVFGPYSHSVYVKSTFTGIGPRVGFDGSYFLTNRFAFTGDIAANLLAGVLKYSTGFTSFTSYTGGSTPHNNTPTNTSMANQNIQRVVPEMDAKIAMLYKTSFDNSTELTIQAGYLFAVYFNAIHQVLPTTLVPGAWEDGTVAIINQSQLDSNIDLNGPFVSFSLTF